MIGKHASRAVSAYFDSKISNTELATNFSGLDAASFVQGLHELRLVDNDVDYQINIKKQESRTRVEFEEVRDEPVLVQVFHLEEPTKSQTSGSGN